MYLSDVVGIALAIIGFLLSLQGLWLVCRALWPARVAAASVRCRDAALTSFAAGIPITLLAIAVVAALARRFGAPGQFIGFSLGGLFFIFANVGTAGFVTHIGQRLGSPADAQRPWMATVRGGAVLELAYLIPLLGWFGLLPISLLLGAGAISTSLRTRPRSSIAPPAADIAFGKGLVERPSASGHALGKAPDAMELELPALETEEAVR